MNDQNTQNPAADPSVVNPTTTADQMAPVGSVAPAVPTQAPDLSTPVVPEPVAPVVTEPAAVEQPVTVQPTDLSGGSVPPTTSTV